MQLGDYILKDEVGTREGSARYVKMADYANRMGYVIEERRIPIQNMSYTEAKESMVTQDVYQIVEPSLPEPPTRKEALEQELAQIDTRLSELDYIGIKIATGRGTREEYASEIAEMQRLADRKNEILASLSTL